MTDADETSRQLTAVHWRGASCDLVISRMSCRSADAPAGAECSFSPSHYRILPSPALAICRFPYNLLARIPYHTVSFAAPQAQIALQVLSGDWLFETGLHLILKFNWLRVKARSARRSTLELLGVPPPRLIGLSDNQKSEGFPSSSLVVG